MKSVLQIPSPLETLNLSFLNKSSTVKFYIKRDDLIHSEISGNKWRKLKFNFEAFKQGKYDAVLTFGGAFSNHIAATAAAGKLFGIPTIGIIRGNELTKDSNKTLYNAYHNDMQLHFVSREEYDLKDEKYYLEELRIKFGNVFIIPEGGANYLGSQGVTEIIGELPFEPDYLLTPCGTGTTAAGLLLATEETQIVSIAVLKGADFLNQKIASLIYQATFEEDNFAFLSRLNLLTDYHFGGYGKYNKELIDFIALFKKETKIDIEEIYTGKMCYALCNLINQDYFKPNSTVVVLHTGGLQGKISH